MKATSFQATPVDGSQAIARSPARIAVVNPEPIQYFAPLYAYVNAADDISLTALYCSDASLREGRSTGFGKSFVWDIDLLEGYESVFLGRRARTRTPGGFFSLVVPEVWTELRSGRYDAVILHGHRYAVYWLALLAAKLSGVRVMMRCETHLGLARSRWHRVLRRPIMGTLFRLCDRLLAIGSANAAFYRAMGAAEHRISLVPYAVDNERFAAASQLSAAERTGVLETLRVPAGRPIVLYASKFQRRKRAEDVVRAAAELVRRSVDFTLLLVGDGEQRSELQALVRELRLDNVVFAGFINQNRLPAVYGVADVFVLPSENEPWGLVVNEVMCAAVPVVVADGVGCVPDLVVHGENGFVYRPGDASALSRALHTLLTDPALRRRMGERSRERITNWSFEQSLQGIREAVHGESD